MRAYPFFSVAVFAAIISTFSCSSGDDGPGENEYGGGNSSDSGGGITCNADFGEVPIGTQIWAKKNLNCDVAGSKCYDNDLANCEKYGRLYDWATAMALPSSCNSNPCPNRIQAKHRGICLSGWHIPSEEEWEALKNAVGGISVAGVKLKATSGWYNDAWNGNGTDDYGFSALPGGAGHPDYSYTGSFKSSLFSVRCVKD